MERCIGFPGAGNTGHIKMADRAVTLYGLFCYLIYNGHICVSNVEMISEPMN